MPTQILRSEPLTSNTQIEYFNQFFNAFEIKDYANQTSGVVLIDIEPEISHNKWILIKSIFKKSFNTDIKICFAQPYEALGWYSNQDTWEKIITLAKQFKFPLDRLMYISGDLRYTPTNTEFDEIKHLGINLFEIVTEHRYTNKFTASNVNKTKKLLCLNFRPREHRKAVQYLLEKHNLIESNYCSFQKSTISPLTVKKFTGTEIDAELLLPHKIIPNDKQWPNGITHQSHTWYDDTVFSLVTETCVKQEVLFLTEKIYKPIMYGHPFVVFGNPGSLKYLQSKGYQTFPELFDESYDTIQDPVERLNKIIKICNTVDVQNYTPSVLSKLKHNQNLFFSKENSRVELQKLKEFLSQTA